MGITNVEAVFLSIDPALHTSGATILIPDYGNPTLGEEPHPFRGDYVLYEFGKVISQGERARFVESLLEMSDELSESQEKYIPPVVVAEEWDGPRDRRIRLAGGEMGWARDPKWTYTTIMAIGEGWGRWSAEIEAANEFRREEKLGPDIILHRVRPNDWRDRVFGNNRAVDSASLKTAAVRLFSGVFGFDASHDIAEAGCIGLYGLSSREIETAIEKWQSDADKFFAEVEAEEKAKKNAAKVKKRKKR